MKKTIVYGFVAFAVMAIMAISPLAAGWTWVEFDDVSGVVDMTIIDSNGMAHLGVAAPDIDGRFTVHDLSTGNVNSMLSNLRVDDGGFTYATWNRLNDGTEVGTLLALSGHEIHADAYDIEWADAYMYPCATGGYRDIWYDVRVCGCDSAALQSIVVGQDLENPQFSKVTGGAGYQHIGLWGFTNVDTTGDVWGWEEFDFDTEQDP